MNNRKAFLAVVGLTAVYSIVLIIFQCESIWDWFNTLVATGISFFLAVLAGIYLYNHQGESDQKLRREVFKTLLSAEISDAIRILDGNEMLTITISPNDILSVKIAFVQPLVLEQSVLEGVYGCLDSENMLNLARTMRMYNFSTSYLMALLASSNHNVEAIRHAVSNVEASRVAIISKSKLFAERFDILISEQESNSR